MSGILENQKLQYALAVKALIGTGKKWKEMPNYPNFFLTENAEIASIKWSNQFKKKMRFKILKPQYNKRIGYFYIGVINKKKERKLRPVHRLMLETFIGDCPLGQETLHGEKGKKDNSLSNLKWGTHEQNVKDKIRDGITVKGSKNPMAKLNENEVNCIKNLKGFKQRELANIFNVSTPNISLILGEKRWKKNTI